MIVNFILFTLTQGALLIASITCALLICGILYTATFFFLVQNKLHYSSYISSQTFEGAKPSQAPHLHRTEPW